MLARQEDPWAPLRTYRNSLLQEAPGEQAGKSHKHMKKHRKGGVKRKLAMQGGKCFGFVCLFISLFLQIFLSRLWGWLFELSSSSSGVWT